MYVTLVARLPCEIFSGEHGAFLLSDKAGSAVPRDETTRERKADKISPHSACRLSPYRLSFV